MLAPDFPPWPMAAQPGSEHFIPFDKADLIRMCCSDPALEPARQEALRTICAQLSLIFNAEFHATLEALKQAYAPQNPDRDTRPDPLPRAESTPSLMGSLRTVLEAANYRAIERASLEQALREHSLMNIRLEVNFDDFEEVLFFKRGESQRQETLSSHFGLRRRPVAFTSYDRVLVYVKFREAAAFSAERLKTLSFVPGTTLLKLFQNVPSADLEMLFPNTQVRMRTLDKLLIGIPAAAGGIALLVTKLGGSLLLLLALLAFALGLRSEPVQLNQATLMTLAAGIGTLGAFLFRQFGKFKNRKIHFLKTLTDNLYFRNLDNNAGVFHYLIDSAEEEECKECVLAYHLLIRTGQAMSETDLDRAVETWMAQRWDCHLDFEADDALSKLVRLGLATREDQRYRAVPLEAAQRVLRQRWNQLGTQISAAGLHESAAEVGARG